MLGTVSSWEVLVASAPTAAAQMAFDERLARRARPTLRLFRWAAPAVSLGFRQVPPAWSDEAQLAAHGVERVERPTGGGIAVHGSDLSCSVIAPREFRLHRLMADVCEALSEAVRAVGVAASWHAEVERPVHLTYCLIEAGPYAIMAGDRKVGGLAARRYPTCWLIQGSVLVRPLPAVFERVMPPAVREQFSARAISLEEASGNSVSETELIDHVIRVWETKG